MVRFTRGPAALSQVGFGCMMVRRVSNQDHSTMTTRSCRSRRCPWTGSLKILRVGPSASGPEGKPVAGDKLLYLDFPSGLCGRKR